MMCSAGAERDVRFARDVCFASDVRFAREKRNTSHHLRRSAQTSLLNDRSFPSIMELIQELDQSGLEKGKK